MKRFAKASTALALALLGGRASAQEGAACVDAAEEGQRVRDQNKFLDAKRRFERCARTSCPQPIQSDCIGFLDQLRKRMPSLVIRARNAAGQDLVEVRVFRDGKPILERLEGTAVDVEPGASTFRFEAKGHASRDLKIVVAEGVQRRIVDVVLAPSGTPAPAGAAPAMGPGAAPWIVGGVGLLGFGAFGVMQGVAWKSYDEVKHRCGAAGTCSDGDLGSVRANFAVSMAGLGVGIAGVTTAVVLHLVLDKRRPDRTSSWETPLRFRF